MRSPANRRRSPRNRRNRSKSPTTTNENPPRHIEFSPKLKYENSFRNGNGVFVLSKRKRMPITEEEKQRRKQRRREIEEQKISLISLRHKVCNLWQHGMHTADFQFGPGKSASIVAFLQQTYPKYVNKAAASSFFYRAINRFKVGRQTPHLEAHRDRRGENKPKIKRANPAIIQLCDELLSEPKATAPKVQRGLQRNGFSVSLSTIYRISQDLLYRWTKPWHTDVLTPAQKLKRKLFCAQLLQMPAPALLNTIGNWMFTDEKWWDLVGPAAYKYVKAASDAEAKQENQVFIYFLIFFIHVFIQSFCFLQVPRNKSKKGGIKKRVYFWGGICWWCKTPGVAWTAADMKVCYKHTKNLCVGTLFEDEDDDGLPCVFRIVQTRAAAEDNNVSYVSHFQFPDGDPPENQWLFSSFGEVQEWHRASRHVLAQREDLRPPTSMQDTRKTMQIYNEALYPTLTTWGLNKIVEDNASPHNNETIRESHRAHNVHIVGYTATEDEKENIRALIRAQVASYRREQDKQAQMTKQTRELDRLPAWPPNSPDLNLIEVVWSWMVRWIRDHDDGWPRDAETLKVRVLEAWDAIPLESFRELARSYRVRLMAIHSVDGDRHPQFA